MPEKRRRPNAAEAAVNSSYKEDDRSATTDPDTILMIDEALERLNAEDPVAASIARLRLFAGLEIAEASEVLGVSRATAFRDWAYARDYLSDALS